MKVFKHLPMVLGLTLVAVGQVHAANPMRNQEAVTQQQAQQQVQQQTQQQVQQKAQQQVQVQQTERIYGSDLMTPQERLQYQAKMQSLKTEQEREQFRKEHHEQMKARAQKLGKALPDEPPAVGPGQGKHKGWRRHSRQ